MPTDKKENSESMVTIPLEEYEVMKAKIEKLKAEAQALDSTLMKIYRPIMKSKFAKTEEKTEKVLSQLLDGKFECEVTLNESFDPMNIWLCVSYKIKRYELE